MMCSMKSFLFSFLSLLVPFASAAPRIQVSDNHRFLVREGGKPFFYLGDTAWEMFHRLSRADAETYLKDRAAKGFTVIQSVALAEFDGLVKPNVKGHLPLLNNDPTKPDVKEGENNDYWDDVDAMVRKANELGLVVGFLPTWGDKWNKKWGKGPEIFTPQNAEVYGKWLGQRYKEADLIWILGGDRPPETELHKEIIRAMAKGVAEGDGGAHLITFHPTGGTGSSIPFHEDKWLSFNMRQNGHIIEYGRHAETLVDYSRTPAKPVIDAEPVYEGHPVNFKSNEFGYSIAADVRRPLYWDLFNGACGHTYGHHSIWQFASKDGPNENFPVKSWQEAIQDPGGSQMIHARRLIESRPILTRIPDSSIIVESKIPSNEPGAGSRRFVATRDTDKTYAFVYAPVSKRFTVKIDAIAGPEVVAWWYNPRDGSAEMIGKFQNTETKTITFTPASEGESLDWVLVLDDAAKNYPKPGTVAK